MLVGFSFFAVVIGEDVLAVVPISWLKKKKICFVSLKLCVHLDYTFEYDAIEYYELVKSCCFKIDFTYDEFEL